MRATRRLLLLLLTVKAAMASLATELRLYGKGCSVNKLSLSAMICTVFLFWAATAIVSPAQTFTTLVNFYSTDGSGPLTAQGLALVQATDGDFYGTTAAGGASDVCDINRCGTVFKITRAS
jgi:hypothetical protein